MNDSRRGMKLEGGIEEIADLFSGRQPGAAPSEVAGLHRKQRVREFYDQINDGLNGSIYAQDAIFFNFGYQANDQPRAARIELPAQLPNRNRIELVLELIGACELAERDLLDVGCRRGGSIYTIDRLFSTGEIWGLDLSPSAVAFCQRHLGKDYVHFVTGDSERLPFIDGFFEVVLNVESSCLYADIYAFYSEVYRVLGAGGRFLYTDLMPVEHLADYMSFLRGLGFTLERDQDITSNVLLSLDRNAARQFEVHGEEIAKEVLEFFLAAPGSKPYQDLEQGRLSYRIWQFCKPA